MTYTPITPNQIGIYYLHDINLKEIVEFIDWRFYFLAWRLSGRYEGIEQAHHCPACQAKWLTRFDAKDRPKAEEALKLFSDTQEVLHDVVENNRLKINAVYALLPAYSEDDNIVIETEGGKVTLPTLRQQKPSADGFCYSLSDFLAERNDFLGAFANTVLGANEMAKAYEKKEELYTAIVIKTLADRLAEATAEWLHRKVRTEFWGYTPNENLSVKEMLKTKYKGIRPAIGYPSLPDQSIIFEMDEILKFNKIGVSLTEHGAMYPNASVTGLYFAHPMSRYFAIGKIDDEQLNDYARRKGKTTDEMRKWLSGNL